MDTTVDHFTPLALRMRGNNNFGASYCTCLDKYQNDAFACILLCLSFFLWVTLCMVQQCITCLLGLIKISGRKFVSYLKDKIYCSYDIGQLKMCCLGTTCSPLKCDKYITFVIFHYTFLPVFYLLVHSGNKRCTFQ